MTKTFILGVGAQKTGTTWLHDYLHRHPQTDMGFSKEYHIFDALFIPECRIFRDRIEAREQRLAKRNLATKPIQRIAFYRDPEAYFDYFAGIAAPEAVRLTGDITPSYAGLPASALKLIRDGLLARGFAVRAVFLMRDPVERIWSAVRMARRNALEKSPGHVFGQSESAHFAKVFRNPETEFRSRYDSTIANLEAVFPPADIHYQLYERLFTEPAIRALTAFLGIDYAAPAFDTRANASPKLDALEPAIRAEAVAHYAPAYRAAAARFGAEALRAAWPSFAHSEMA